MKTTERLKQWKYTDILKGYMFAFWDRDYRTVGFAGKVAYGSLVEVSVTRGLAVISYRRIRLAIQRRNAAGLVGTDLMRIHQKVYFLFASKYIVERKSVFLISL